MAVFGSLLSAAVLFASCGPTAPPRTLAVSDDAITVDVEAGVLLGATAALAAAAVVTEIRDLYGKRRRLA
jgi:hypothetical protein